MFRIRIKYDSFDDLLHKLSDLHATAERHQSHVRGFLGQLDAQRWTGRGADAFRHEITDQILPAVDKLEAALLAIIDKMGRARDMMRDAEQQAAALFRGDITVQAGSGAMAGVLGDMAAGRATTTAPNAHPSLNGRYEGLNGMADRPAWLTEYSDADGGRTGAQNADVLFINGIMTDSQSHISGVLQVSQALGNVPVTGIYNKTDGIASDVWQSFNDWSESLFGSRLAGDNPAVNEAMKWIREHPDGKIVVHSQGAAVMSAALMNLSREKPPFNLSNLNVTTMGGAGAKFPTGPTYRHLVFTGDLVPMRTLSAHNPTMLDNHVNNREYTIINHSETSSFLGGFITVPNPGATHDRALYLRNLGTFDRVEAAERNGR